MPHAQVTLPGLTSSVPTARRFVESLLTSWGEPDLGWTAAVCVSELAANCALHARTQFSVAVDLEDATVRIAVSDSSPRVPAPRHYGTEATTGRGLRLVDEYASDWGVETGAGGKTVWLVLVGAAPGSGVDEELADERSLEQLLATFDDSDASPTASGPSDELGLRRARRAGRRVAA